jgi:RNA polymerase sigma-70 factor (ECF subfamily)
LDAEECVNDSYLGVWNVIPPERPNPLLTFVCKIVRNISIKKYHVKTAMKRNSAYDVAMSEVSNYILSPNNVEAEIEAKELAHIIEKFLDTLTVENRVIFMRRYWFSDTYKDIADRVGITEKMVSMRLTRIRKQMREYLMEREVLV